MQYDIFFSISQTPVDGHLPTEQEMFRNFFRQVEAADAQGYGVAWIAESHLSSEVQKGNRRPVIPHWEGEIGLNANFFQLASHVFRRTKRIECGSAVHNIVCMGGPIASAERVATTLALHGLDPDEQRRIHVGFSAGRFQFMNEASGVVPRNDLERAAWPALRGRIFAEAAEIFIRLLRGDVLSSDDIPPTVLTRESFWVTASCGSCGATWDVPYALRAQKRCRSCGSDEITVTEAAWERVRAVAGEVDEVEIDRRWTFENLEIVPRAWRRELLQLVIGSHDPRLQEYVNTLAPVQVFNLSITRPEVIEGTHRRLAEHYHPDGGPWERGHMPRTTFVFLNEQPDLTPEQRSVAAREEATKALSAYWKALQGTLDPRKVEAAADNALVGSAEDIAQQIRERFHPDDRLMLWFDFFNHDCDRVIANQAAFMERVVPLLESP
jgi:alkanesulfonate monooxygenase SsuD/methylene tetrahydromethanopterin reductase-like flavin-dependent oxidoreductase (luciferase family)